MRRREEQNLSIAEMHINTGVERESSEQVAKHE
jgi:hypothetical protein